MGDTAQYIQVGFLVISQANLSVIGLLLLVFALAVLLPIPGEPQGATIEWPGPSGAGDTTAPREDPA